MSAADVLARFSRDFGVPFLMGRRAIVADPLGTRGFEAVKHGLSVDVELQDACDAQFTEAALWCDVTPAPFDHDAATLLYAGHDLYATTHPQASSFYARSHVFAKAAMHAVAALPRTLDPGRLVTRHLVVRRIFRATRTDVRVSWWTGSETFHGQEPPTRLVALPGLRRVQQERSTLPMWRLALASGDEELRISRHGLMVALLDASPLTRLMMAGDPLHKHLGFSLVLPTKIKGKKASPLDVVEDKRLARMVSDSLLDDGLDVSGASIALALLQGLREGVSPQIIRRAAELCTHLALLACVIEAEVPGSRESRPLIAFLQRDPTSLKEATRIYWAVVSATLALGRQGVLHVPLDALPPTTQGLVAKLHERCEHPRIVGVSQPLRRELGRRLPRSLAPPSSSSSSSSSSSAAEREAHPDAVADDLVDASDVAPSLP